MGPNPNMHALTNIGCYAPPHDPARQSSKFHRPGTPVLRIPNTAASSVPKQGPQQPDKPSFDSPDGTVPFGAPP